MNLWLGVGALISVALIFLLVPLWRTRLAPRLAVSIVAGEEEAGSMPDPGSARAGRRWMTLALLGVMPALTAGLYLYLGAPTILQEQALTQAHAAYDTDAMVKALEGKLKAKPDDAEGWYALGRAYIALQRLDEAELALAKAAQLAPKEAGCCRSRPKPSRSRPAVWTAGRWSSSRRRWSWITRMRRRWNSRAWRPISSRSGPSRCTSGGG
jgi:cytochrome c-type biogenesis protein CcmH